MKRSIIVTGGAGFIGSNLVKRLVSLGFNVIVIDDFSTGKAENLNGVKDMDLCQVYEYDIKHNLKSFLEQLNEKHKNIFGLFHLAAQVSVQKSIEDPKEDALQNFYPIYDIIEFLSSTHGVEFLTFASSAAVYGEQKSFPIKEDFHCKPMSPYAIHKLSCEYALKTYLNKMKTQVRALRFFNVYGPCQDPKSPYSGVISKFLQASKNDDTLTVFGTGEQTRDFIFVENVVDVLVASMKKTDDKFDILNVGNSSETSILNLAKLINEIAAKENHPLTFKDAQRGDIFRSFCNNEKMLKMISKYEFVTLKEGLKKTYSWV